MKCWWPDIKYIGCGDYVPGMVEGSDGDYVLVDDHLTEVRHAQRRVIAALYWRAGMLDDFANEPDGDPYAREHAYALRMHIEAIERAMGATP